MIGFECLVDPFFTLYDPFDMEHAVPQNVTSFEFRLVGDMTLKQFGYLSAGAAIAYLTFVLLLPINSILAVPIIALSTLSGAAFAFLPIADRSLDHWVIAFFKSIYSPTQGRWKSPYQQGKKPPQVSPGDPLFRNRLQTYLSFTGLSEPVATVAPPKIKPQLSRITPVPTAPIPPPSEVTRYIDSLHAKLAESERTIQGLKTALSQPQPATPTPQAPSALHAAPEAKSAPPAAEASKYTPNTQLLLTSLPNVVNGVVTDANGNYLEGVIVSIHDQNGLPVRASKTNKLGQFAGATPLPSGVYTATFEKENLEFDTAKVNLSGTVLSPLAISAKKGML